MNRRSFFQSTTAAALGTAFAPINSATAAAVRIAREAADPAYKIKNSGIKHTLMGWCWKPMDTMVLAQHAKDIGLVGM
jgi:hydroxypyruvate isomerase